MTAVYTTTTELDRMLSAAGVVSFSDHDDNGDGDSAVVTEVIERASVHVASYVARQYEIGTLANDVQIREWTTVIAAYQLCLTRGNMPPESLAIRYNSIADPDAGILAKIADKHKWHGRLLTATRRRDKAMHPSFSNLTVDRRYPQERVRVTSRNSNGETSALEQDIQTGFASYE
jgi:hypothetical protein